MNARTQERPVSTANSWALAIEETFTCEALAAWLECINDERKQSAYFGPIGDQSLLLQVLFNDRANGDQCKAAAMTLKRRWIAEHTEQIARRETELLS